MKYRKVRVITVFLVLAWLIPVVVKAQQLPPEAKPLDALAARVAALEAKLACMTKEGDDVFFTGCNVNIRDGSEDLRTHGPTNGLGNLIIGYNEGPFTDRTGSHNLVVGSEHSYSSFGGFVAGSSNTISGQFSQSAVGFSTRPAAVLAMRPSAPTPRSAVGIIT